MEGSRISITCHSFIPCCPFSNKHSRHQETSSQPMNFSKEYISRNCILIYCVRYRILYSVRLSARVFVSKIQFRVVYIWIQITIAYIYHLWEYNFWKWESFKRKDLVNFLRSLYHLRLRLKLLLYLFMSLSDIKMHTQCKNYLAYIFLHDFSIIKSLANHRVCFFAKKKSESSALLQ